MNEHMIEKIVPELRNGLVGLTFREMFQLKANQFAIAFEGDEFKLLLIAIDASEPRIYLIKRRIRDLKKEKQNPSKFVVDAAHALRGRRLADIVKQKGERVVDFRFDEDESKFLIAQLTGRSSNLFLLDADRTIIAAARKPMEGEQSIGMAYSPPAGGAPRRTRNDGPETLTMEASSRSLSESLDAYFQQKEAEANFDDLANDALRKNQKQQAKLRRLIKNLEMDIQQHGDPEKWKKYGDLLLANRATAERKNGSIIVRDLFDVATPLIEIEADEHESVPEAAQKYFRKYAKARNASQEIAARIEQVRAELAELENESSTIERAIAARDVNYLSEYVGREQETEPKFNKSRTQRLPAGVRSFRSSDGFEILVGKKATDNDFLTFRIASSRDTWMHAADYPGSHVVIRNPDRKEIPQKTLIEAAQLAAFYSQGKKQVKAAVNYTEKKFVNKPKGSAPGLVRLASFKTILVDPKFPDVLQS